MKVIIDRTIGAEKTEWDKKNSIWWREYINSLDEQKRFVKMKYCNTLKEVCGCKTNLSKYKSW